jgi:hypothetical protein
VPQGTWGVLWKHMVCPYWMLMEFPISPYHWLGLLAHIPNDQSDRSSEEGLSREPDQIQDG